MEQLIELLRQIEELAGVAIEALNGAAGGGGGQAEGAPPPEEGAGPPPPPEKGM